jgi:hypothetical protein
MADSGLSITLEAGYGSPRQYGIIQWTYLRRIRSMSMPNITACLLPLQAQLSDLIAMFRTPSRAFLWFKNFVGTESTTCSSHPLAECIDMSRTMDEDTASFNGSMNRYKASQKVYTGFKMIS